jgi:hypothetical protein
LNWFLPRSFSFANPKMAAASSNIYTSDIVEVFQTKCFSWLCTSELFEIYLVLNVLQMHFITITASVLEPICRLRILFFISQPFTHVYHVMVPLLEYQTVGIHINGSASNNWHPLSLFTMSRKASRRMFQNKHSSFFNELH